MNLWQKIVKFFEEPPPPELTPVEYEGKTFVRGEYNDAWPNGLCAKCGGIGLKPTLYYNKESDTYYHQDCLQALAAGK